MLELPCPASPGTPYSENGFPQPSLQMHQKFISWHSGDLRSSVQHAIAGRTVRQFDNYY